MPRYGLEQPARGTVAQVLAHARASLKEPSRPFTPAESRPGTVSDQLRPSSAFGQENQYAIFDSDVHSRKSRKGARGALSRGMPAAAPDSPTSREQCHSTHRVDPAMTTPPAWVGEMDELILRLDTEMAGLANAGSTENGRLLPRVRTVLGSLWSCVEAMAGACNDGDERWVLQRNRLFASLFRVLERREADLRISAARCVLCLLSAGRASMAASLQLPKYETAVCKVLFQLTKASRNDDAFFEAGAVQPMLALLEAQSRQLNQTTRQNLTLSAQDANQPKVAAALPVDAPVFLAGALKNISASEGAQQRLGQLGAVSVLCTLMQGARDALLKPPRSSSVKKSKAPESSSGSSGGDPATQQEEGEEEVVVVTEKQQVQLLTHVTGALRNLSLAKSHHKQIAACGAPALLCSLVSEPFMFRHSELMFNVTRVLAKISLHEGLRQGINTSRPENHLASLLALMEYTAARTLPTSSPHTTATTTSRSSSADLEEQQQGIALLVRLAFTLGNLTASNDKNRRHMLLEGGSAGGGGGGGGGGGDLKSGPMLLVDILGRCHDAWIEEVTASAAGASAEDSKGEGKSAGGQLLASEMEELLVKLIRLVANLSISPRVGPAFVALPGVAVLVPILERATHLMARDSSEELLLNAVSAVTNLSFYPAEEGGGGRPEEKECKEDELTPRRNFLFESKERVCACLVDVLLHENEEAVAEAARAFGNFSRDAKVRSFMCATKADEVLVILLDHSSRDVVMAAAGALVNLGADPHCSSSVTAPPSSPSSSSPTTDTGCSKLLYLVRRAGLRDVAMSAVACKALFNVLAAVVHQVTRKHKRLGEADEAKESEALGEDEEVLVALESALGSVVGRAGVLLLHSTLDELLSAAAEDSEEDEDDDGGFRLAARALFQLVDRPLKGEEERHEERRRRQRAASKITFENSAYEELAPPVQAGSPTSRGTGGCPNEEKE